LAGAGGDSAAEAPSPSGSTVSGQRKLRPVEEHPAKAYRGRMPRLPKNVRLSPAHSERTRSAPLRSPLSFTALGGTRK
jgi:hypothetical protein